MQAIDYLTVFLLLGSAPFWQQTLDGVSAGLGSSLVLILLIAAIHASLYPFEERERSRSRPRA